MYFLGRLGFLLVLLFFTSVNTIFGADGFSDDDDSSHSSPLSGGRIRRPYETEEFLRREKTIDYLRETCEKPNRVQDGDFMGIREGLIGKLDVEPDFFASLEERLNEELREPFTDYLTNMPFPTTKIIGEIPGQFFQMLFTSFVLDVLSTHGLIATVGSSCLREHESQIHLVYMVQIAWLISFAIKHIALWQIENMDHRTKYRGGYWDYQGFGCCKKPHPLDVNRLNRLRKISVLLALSQEDLSSRDEDNIIKNAKENIHQFFSDSIFLDMYNNRPGYFPHLDFQRITEYLYHRYKYLLDEAHYRYLLEEGQHGRS